MPSIPNCSRPGCAWPGSFVAFDGPFMPVHLCALCAEQLIEFGFAREARGESISSDDRQRGPDWYWLARLWLAGMPSAAQRSLTLPLSRVGGAR